MVDGDDLTMLGWEKEFDWSWTRISTKPQPNHRDRLGPKNSDANEIRIRNRVITWADLGMHTKLIRGILKAVGSKEGR